jgi:hypothetical protein
LKERIKLLINTKTNMEKIIIEWSAGNPGAMGFLISCMEPDNIDSSIVIFPFLEKATSIRGSNLYVLWSDLCGRNVKTVARLIENCPVEIIEDACSRQDYSGRELIQDYL